ncbi:MAG: sodium-translocating pyrophosphatase [Candidatus Micrarchaeota archaeon]
MDTASSIKIAALAIAPLAALLAIVYSVVIFTKLKKENTGTEKMKEIAGAIREGSIAYLKRQFKTIAIFVALIALITGLALGIGTALAFILGALLSALTAYLGMRLAVMANVRTAQAARKGIGSALRIAYSAGTVDGMFLAGLGLLGISIICIVCYVLLISQGEAQVIAVASEVLIGFGFGGSLIALFMRVGGGIYTKGADVGADLVGKVETRIPEDDPRNPATIADNVGDNVGDCAGTGADLFESYAATAVAAMILGGAAYGMRGILFPLFVYSAGIFASILGTMYVRRKSTNSKDSSRLILLGFVGATLITAVFTLIFVQLFFGEMKIFYAAAVGLLATIAITFMTDYYTSSSRKPVQEIARASQTGAATNLITGLSVGMESTFVAIVIVAAAIYAGYAFAGFYGIGVAGLGMLATVGILMSMDTYGPIVDNAHGICEMSGIEKEARENMSKLDEIGNTMKALTKGFAISSAAIAAVALYSTYFLKTGLTGINISLAHVFVGLLLGGALPYLFSSYALRAVARAASLMVAEVRDQFKKFPGILKGTQKPDYARCVDISTAAALRELVFPAALVLFFPIIVGFSLGAEALGAFLGGAILSAQLLGVFMCTGGAAWDNAKKYVESGVYGGKGTETHAAAVVGDTVGDPMKDTAGPSLNILVKILNIISLLIAGFLATRAFGVL